MPSLDELFERFPEMRPIHKPPSLFALYGCGTRAFGDRDYDPETGTYVVTHWFTLLYLPIIPLGSYRVANAANGGWYCLGRVPVSGAAKGWAVCLLLIVAGATGWIAWQNHINSPGYKEHQLFEEGNQKRDRCAPWPGTAKNTACRWGRRTTGSASRRSVGSCSTRR
jgi:hypothetical protein